jgi:mycofactocin precursor
VSEPHAQAPPPAGTEPEVTPEMHPVNETHAAELIAEDLLVEEVSIDGMCGVY